MKTKGMEAQGVSADCLQALLGGESPVLRLAGFEEQFRGTEGLSQPLWSKRKSYRRLQEWPCRDEFPNEIGKAGCHLLENMPFSSGMGQE